MEPPPQEPVLGPGQGWCRSAVPRPGMEAPSKEVLRVAWGWESPSVSVWICGGVHTAGPGAPPVSVITFFLLTIPTMVSIGCDILIK